MKKIFYYNFLFFIFIVSMCISLYPFSKLSICILGGWSHNVTISNGKGSRELKDQYLFLPFHILLIKVNAPTGEEYTDVFSYRVSGPDNIMLKGRLIDEFQVFRDGKALVVDSLGGFPPDGRYLRTISFWVIFGLKMLILIFVPNLIWVIRTRKFV